MKTMHSRANIAGHPLHAMLVAFPVTLYTSTFVSFIAYAVTGNLFWWNVALFANVAGVVMAAVAALPGFIDWRAIPDDTPAKATGFRHLIINVSALAVFAANLVVQRERWGSVADPVAPSPVGALVLTGMGVALTMLAGTLGWRLVQTHHVGVKLTDAQAREELLGQPTVRASAKARVAPTH